MNDFARRLRELREQKGLTQTELADIVGVTWSAISKYERGIVDNLPYGRMSKLAEALGTSVAYLTSGKRPLSNLVVDADDNLLYDDAAIVSLYEELNTRPRLREAVIHARPPVSNAS